ncbi:hypothetical protein HAX54_051376 [Datura stramonium]|uniref:DAGKc domain-containing protein n=1 Tax=Datura stramonium TaxID=4076 RepID=A0ABS8WMC5_DATST|nr:hypothetical protein [Datura stramonium]
MIKNTNLSALLRNFFRKSDEAAITDWEVDNILKDYYIRDYILLSEREMQNDHRVFDLGEKTPNKVLHQFYSNLEKHKQNGDNLSYEIERRLRVIVAGGDGTAGWIIGVFSDLKLAHPPPIATGCQGTGNNLPFAFGWGKKNWY